MQIIIYNNIINKELVIVAIVSVKFVKSLKKKIGSVIALVRFASNLNKMNYVDVLRCVLFVLQKV